MIIKYLMEAKELQEYCTVLQNANRELRKRADRLAARTEYYNELRNSERGWAFSAFNERAKRVAKTILTYSEEHPDIGPYEANGDEAFRAVSVSIGRLAVFEFDSNTPQETSYAAVVNVDTPDLLSDATLHDEEVAAAPNFLAETFARHDENSFKLLGYSGKSVAIAEEACEVFNIIAADLRIRIP